MGGACTGCNKCNQYRAARVVLSPSQLSYLRSSGAVELIVQPADGIKPVVTAIANAQKTLDLFIFLGPDLRAFAAALAAEGGRR